MLAATILVALVALITIMVPGFLCALALLRKTELNLFEITVIGFILGFMFPATLTWLESYLMNYIHFFAYSAGLFAINALIITIIAGAFCYQQGAFKSFKEEYLTKGNAHDLSHRPAHHSKGAKSWVWIVLFIIMITVFLTRLQSIVIAPIFFEFDPYFDMIDTQYILTYGQEILYDHSSWPAVATGTDHRVEPIVPYIEAYWYDLSNAVGSNYQSLNTNLLSLVGGVYPPITAALLVFVIFMILYHEYNEYIALIAAGLSATMPVLFTTFIAGEQLVEPWGIFALFFFIAAYMLAVKNPKNYRLALFAGIAFASNFLGAHYYTVTVGVYVVYLLLQGAVDIIRGESNLDFYKMNAVVIATIAVLFVLFLPFSSTLQSRVPTIIGVPIVIAGPIVALLLVAFLDYGLAFLNKNKIVFNNLNWKSRFIWVAAIAIIAILLIFLTPLGNPLHHYLALSAQFTTPSSPLFMTVEEYIPTGFFYDFGAQGLGVVAQSLAGVPIMVWGVIVVTILLIAMSIVFRNSRTGILYMAIALPLMFAGFSEVKYLPHFGVAYIIFFCIILGELCYLAEQNFKIGFATKKEVTAEQSGQLLEQENSRSSQIKLMILAVGLFFVSTILAIIYIIYAAMTGKFKDKNLQTYAYGLGALFIFTILLVFIFSHIVLYGESSSYINAIAAGFVALQSTSNAQLCNTLAQGGSSLGYSIYCNTIPQYWLDSMAWLKQNVGPNAPRVLSWWDYGDWINWFGNSNAFLRGDNANATEDYATAAHFVLNTYTPQSLATFMNGNQSKYVLLDQDLISKWQALDFLACIYANQTSYKFAQAAGQSQSPPEPYALGSSECEIQHDPQYALIPYAALVGNYSQQSINYYCSISTSTQQYVTTYLVDGNNLTNQTVCVNILPNKQGVLNIYTSNGVKINAYLQSANYLGVIGVQGTPFVEYMMIYAPNGPNQSITDAPSSFYTSNYYKGFILGNLTGFTEVYPSNAVGINFINGTYPVRIFELNNYTGQLPPVTPKPSWIHNNYSIPG